jgi:hypothetical protein
MCGFLLIMEEGRRKKEEGRGKNECIYGDSYPNSKQATLIGMWF